MLHQDIQDKPNVSAGAAAPVVPEDRSVDPASYMQSLSTWGKWGKDDILGAVNYITPEVRKQAAKLVRTGETVGCGWRIEDSPSGMGMQRRMRLLPNDLAPGSHPAGARLKEIAEDITFTTHMVWITHLDTPNHLTWDGLMYNGHSASTVSASAGGQIGDPAVLDAGIISRGVLFDMPRMLGVEALEPGQAVTPEQLDAAERRTKVKVRPGDIVLLRTGNDKLHRQGVERGISGTAGWHPTCLPWLRDRGVAIIGHDGPHDVFPNGFEWSAISWAHTHVVAIIAMGVWILDYCNLEDLSKKCAELNRYEFMFSIEPLRLAGCSASPVQPLATF